jgi:uncharacterized protein (TIGR00290 family)
LKEKVAISWSGGKDCALALFEMLQSNQHEVVSLHTSFNQNTNRVGLHGIKQDLIEAQAKSIRIPLDKIFVPSADDHVMYERAMSEYYQSLASVGIRKIVFGDIFLEDLKEYREKMLSRHGLEGIFPLWKLDSRTVARKFIQTGFKAVVCAADAKYFNENDVGRSYDFDFINALNLTVDPCGENGEFHTFVYDGPLFKEAVAIERHQIETKEYTYKVNLPGGRSEARISKFWFQELSL